MEIEILFFVSLATEKIPDFKTLQVFAGSFVSNEIFAMSSPT